MIKHFEKQYKPYQEQIDGFISSFNTSGELFGNDKRNAIKLFDLEGKAINIKSFKVPNIFNRIAYRFLRKSKAQRSFEYAKKLLSSGIGTPQPIAFYETHKRLLFNRSYYVSEHLDYDLTYRELIRDLDYPDHDTIVRAFTKFTYRLHESNVYFLDHSPGNTLIKKVGDSYQFYLVDLNRMKFKPLTYKERIKNFERLTIHESMVTTMSEVYADLMNKPFQEVFDLMWKSTQEYQKKFHRKRKVKKRLKFWK